MTATYVCWEAFSLFKFGRVLHESPDVILVEEIEPGTVYRPERTHYKAVERDKILGSGTRWAMSRAALRGRWLREPRNTLEQAREAVRKLAAEREEEGS